METTIKDTLFTRSKKFFPLFGMLVLSTALSVMLLFTRINIIGQPTYVFLLWNLFLAWVPFFLGIVISLLKHRNEVYINVLIWLIVFLWLLFFPNAPYIITDFVHLRSKFAAPVWYDILLIFSFAWNGLILAFSSLYLLQNFIHMKFNKLVSWIFVLVAISLCGFGIYLGRFSGWNSWDLFVYPSFLLGDIKETILNPLANKDSLQVTIVFSVFLGIAYLTLTSFLKIKDEK